MSVANEFGASVHTLLVQGPLAVPAVVDLHGPSVAMYVGQVSSVPLN